MATWCSAAAGSTRRPAGGSRCAAWSGRGLEPANFPRELPVQAFDILDDDFEQRRVVLLRCRELLDSLGQRLVGGKDLAELDEGADDQNAHLDRAVAVQDRREHRDAVLGERQRRVLGVAAAAFF
jgi:hypothetical protein